MTSIGGLTLKTGCLKLANRGRRFVTGLYLLVAVMISGCDSSEPIALSPVPLTPPTHAPQDNPSQPMNSMVQSTTHLAWSAPSSWVEEPPASQMRLAQWRIADSDTTEAIECRVAGSGGSVEANLSIWMGQFTGPDGQPLDEQAATGRLTVNGLDVTTLELAGTYSTREPPVNGTLVEHEQWGMFGSVIVAPEGLYLFKCVGPEESILRNRGIFNEFIQSLTVEDGPESVEEP